MFSKIKMSVKTKNYDATTRNVIGYIKGAVEPGKYACITVSFYEINAVGVDDKT